jgi:hypothetical protein
MGDFRRIAEKIAGLIGDNESITADQLPGIIGDPQGGEPFNCFPGGKDNGRCHRLAVAASLKCKAYAIGRHSGFDKAINDLFNHVLVKCPDTQSAVLITDNWDPETIDKQRNNLRKIQLRIHLEIYLIVAGNVNEIVLKF